MSGRPILTVRGLTVRQDDGQGKAILHDFNLDVSEGEAIMLRGPSGCGKTTLLRCLAELSLYQEGKVRLHDKCPVEYGIPKYRTLVQYIPQRPSLLPGTPMDFLAKIRSFSSRQTGTSSKSRDSQYGSTSNGRHDGFRDETTEAGTNEGLDPIDLAAEWGIEKTLWTREWGTLSGGEAQRVALAVAVGIGGAEVLLLDADLARKSLEYGRQQGHN